VSPSGRPHQDPPDRPRVAVLFTGGTISMTVDPAAGGARPVLDGAALLTTVPGLSEHADIVPIDLGRTPASHFTFAGLLGIAASVRDALASDARLVGAVIVQGTDTIDESAFVYDLVLADDRPVVVTGAMRSADAPGADGPANLRDAVTAAADPALRGEGVVVLMSGEVHAADAVVKLHSSAVDAFGSPEELITHAVDVTGFLDLKRASMEAHRSQIGPETFFLICSE